MIKYFTSKTMHWLIAIILLARIITFISFPFLGLDGPWSLSQAFSYINGIKDSSVFAHDFLGNIFTVHFIDSIYAFWFNTMGMSTYSFIVLEFTIITLTLFVWGYLAHLHKNKAFFIQLLMLGYAISPYIYGFRPENFTLLVISLTILVLIIQIHNLIKLILIAALCVITGLIHHVGGLIIVVLMLYYFLMINKNYFDFFKFGLLGISFAFLFTEGQLINYILLPLKIKSEVSNHLSGIDFSLLLKYFIYSGPIPIIVFILSRRIYPKSGIVFLVLMLLLLSFLGRSYYIVYLFGTFLFMIVVTKTEVPDSNTTSTFFDRFIFTPSIVYSLLVLTFMPIVLFNIETDTNASYRKVIKTMANEKAEWNPNNHYFVTSQLTLEVADKPNARLLYPFMRLNDGVKETTNTVFYINQKEELDWIIRNFKTKNKKTIIKEIVPEAKGRIIVSSFYKFKIKRQSSIGLWSVSFLDN